jgi:cation diffusion facilitator CzcD-associated flavoprotein CzcO
MQNPDDVETGQQDTGRADAGPAVAAPPGAGRRWYRRTVSGGVTGAVAEGRGERDQALRRALAAGARPPRVAVLGAGAGGLCMAIQLKLAGIDTVTVYEKSDGVGGTWRDNTYPGAACDVPSHLYSFSFASKADWSRRFAPQPEILAYFESLVDAYDLGPHLRFGTEVTDATWDDARRVWSLGVRTRSGQREVVEADAVVSALGQLNRPYIPDLPGLAEFGGTVFHSARWDHDHDLRGERVGVIGIGASAIQFVPQVAKVAREVVLFQRSPNYVGPRRDRPYPAWQRAMFARFPTLQRLYRESIYWRLEARFNVMRRDSRLGRFYQDQFTKKLRTIVSDRLPEEALIPDYPPGCKRILIADDWYPTLLKPHVSVVTDPVAKVTPDAVVTEDGREYRLDTLIFGTGFRTTEFLAPLRITGRGGLDLNDVWSDGARAFLGLSVPGFPNFFMLYGPNTNLGHNSILFMIEQQVGYIVQLLEEEVVRGVGAADVRPEVAERFDREVQEAAARTVWAEGCHSWYKTDDGRITNNWTDHTTSYRKRLAHPDLSDWELLPAAAVSA